MRGNLDFTSWQHPSALVSSLLGTHISTARPHCPRGLRISTMTIERETESSSLSDDVSSGGEEKLCHRCSTVSWENLSRSAGYYETRSSLTIAESLEILERSDCRMCRFIAAYLSPQDPKQDTTVLQSVRGSKRFRIWKKSHSTCIGTVSMEHTIHSCAPIILVFRVDPTQPQVPDVRALIPQQLDIALVKSWIAERVDSHEKCELDATLELWNLNLIDCDQKSIVPARHIVAENYRMMWMRSMLLLEL